MNRHLIVMGLSGGITVFIINLTFLYLRIYYVLPGIDKVMHAAGGASVATAVLGIISVRGEMARITLVLVVVLAVSALWEWYERALGFARPLDLTLTDTALDTISATLGSIAAILIIDRKRHA